MTEDVVLLGHGGGGQMTRELIEGLILPALRNPVLEALDDGACIEVPETQLVLTTDSYVVDPILFPGGNIGSLAVCGTVNDLAMQAAEPRCLTLGLILEEGLPLTVLGQILTTLGETARRVGVPVVTGDTKVVQRGKGSGIYINTAGLGARVPGTDVHVSRARPGDSVIVTGTVGDHGIAVMSRREGLAFETELQSDVAPLWGLVRAVLDVCPNVHCLRDPTRGGVTAALCDIAAASGVGIRVRQRKVPVLPAVRGACEFLGLDPLSVANEGKALIVCAPEDERAVLDALHAHELGRRAALIGRVCQEPPGQVLMETPMGGLRVLSMPAGEELPRIC